MPLDRPTMTPPEVAKRFRVSPDKVLTWIRSGELRAVNVAAAATGRPRFVINRVDLADFEMRRAARPASAPTRRRKAPTGVIAYF